MPPQAAAAVGSVRMREFHLRAAISFVRVTTHACQSELMDQAVG